ncbi:MAG: T9SS type A sorting domain-containing protein [Bacteroidales bacterium]|nr:T9SS type A sorting domain-containing protein [Bacteroidales bacterium]
MKCKTLLIVLLLGFIIIFHAHSQQQMENPGFEYWEEIGFGPDTLEPVDWNSLKSSDGGDLINGVIPVTLERSSDAHTGMYSVKLENDTILGMVAPGTMTNGRVHATLPPSDAYVYTIDSMPEFHTPFTDLPDSLEVWAKFFPAGNDIGRIVAVLHSDTAKIADTSQTNWIAVANIDFTGETPDWTKFRVPFVYLSSDTPEYLLFAIYAGDAANALLGSILYLDDFEMVYHETGISSNISDNINLFTIKNELIVDWNNNSEQEGSVITLHDISGKIVFESEVKSNQTNKYQLNIPSGIYICKIQNQTLSFTEKIFVK